MKKAHPAVWFEIREASCTKQSWKKKYRADTEKNPMKKFSCAVLISYVACSMMLFFLSRSLFVVSWK
jgi:hypothetical protein